MAKTVLCSNPSTRTVYWQEQDHSSVDFPLFVLLLLSQLSSRCFSNKDYTILVYRCHFHQIKAEQLDVRNLLHS